MAIVFKMSISRGGWRSKFMKNRSQVLLIILVTALTQSTIIALLVYRPISITKLINANRKIELACRYTDNPVLVAHGVYFGLFNVIALIFAFQTRSLPDNYNEAHYILLSAMLFACVFSTSLPSILVTTGLISRKIFGFSIYSTGIISMLCILLPNIYIIYIHPEINTFSHAAASVTSYNLNHRRPEVPTSNPENSTTSFLPNSVNFS
ncbi:Metabotropic glutamate receptor 5 [Trichoplax sp. H2]|nr:Metabotropic glutamate receptor 5 [Trichoplax sp. H2]|eukprot:RDD36275.1 Metabotropic glutamate receptor 5 [Trichoplax sp. H2]